MGDGALGVAAGELAVAGLEEELTGWRGRERGEEKGRVR